MTTGRGLTGLVEALHNRELFVASSIPAFYTAAAHTILTIVGGLVRILMLIEYQDAAVVNATTTRITVCGVAMEVGAVALATGANRIRVSPMNAAVATIASALVVPAPSVLGFATNKGVVAGPGNIAVTFVTVMAATGRYSLHALYEKINPRALIR